MRQATGVEPPESEEAKVARLQKEADDTKAAEEAKAKEKPGKAKEEKPGKEEKAETPKTVTPAKRIIRKAAGYEPTPEADKLAAAADKLTAAAEKMGEVAKPAKPATPAVVVELNDAEKYELAVLAKAEEMFTSKPQYKGVVERAQRYITELPTFQKDFDKAFEEKWVRANANKEFDDEAARDAAFNDAREAAFSKESEKFKAKFNINIDDVDFRRAEIKLETEPVSRELAEARKKLAEVEAREREVSIAPLAKEKAASAVVDFAAQTGVIVGDEFKDVISGEGVIDEKALEAMPDGDIVGEVLKDAVERAKNFAEATATAFSGGKTDLIDQVLDFCISQEKQILSLPKAQQMQEGKLFMARKEWQKLPVKDRSSYWTLDADSVITLANDAILGGAKRQIDAERAKTTARIERRGLKPAPAKETPAKTVKPQSPASSDPAPATAAPKAASNGFVMDLMRGRTQT